jgi:carboxyl-terminal processing protease
MESNKKKWRSIIILTIIVNLIINLGIYNFDDLIYSSQKGQKANINKLEQAMKIVGNYYVDSVNFNHTVEGALNGALETLDPHSTYITREAVKRNEENFTGRYYGIGIHFSVIDHFITVLSVIPGSPAEEAGLLAGDKIIKIEGKSAKDIATAEVPKKLKGPRGSSVMVTISRRFTDDFDISITRNKIPITTINTWFMLDKKSGYIWLNRFAHTTADEFETALIELERRGMTQLILDLRGNGGGLLQQAVKIAGKFINGNKLIVYTKGRREGANNRYFSDDFGKSIDRDYPLIILINEGSASASEIVAGAIQDYDRGLIVGERSFGKGLVQNEFTLQDNSVLRLTVSKYYTPSGRLIQKPYEGKDIAAYYHDGVDSSFSEAILKKENNETYYTENGRKVYGGGGIFPDSILHYKRYTKAPELTEQIVSKHLYFKAAVNLEPKLKRYKNDFERYLNDYKISDRRLNAFYRLLVKNDISVNKNDFLEDSEYQKQRLKAEIAKIGWGYSAYYQIILQEDSQIKQSLNLFPLAKDLLKSVSQN